MKIISKLFFSFILLFGVVGQSVFAQSIQDIFSPYNGDNSIYTIVVYLIRVSFSLAVLFFFWGIARFILAAGDEKKIEEGKRMMFWGVIALFIMASITGIISLLQGTLGVPGTNMNLPINRTP